MAFKHHVRRCYVIIQAHETFPNSADIATISILNTCAYALQTPAPHYIFPRPQPSLQTNKLYSNFASALFKISTKRQTSS